MLRPPPDTSVLSRAVRGEELTVEEMDWAFDELGVSTVEQIAALAIARGWVNRHGDPPLSDAAWAYLEAFDESLRHPADIRRLVKRWDALGRLRG